MKSFKEIFESWNDVNNYIQKDKNNENLHNDLFNHYNFSKSSQDHMQELKEYTSQSHNYNNHLWEKHKNQLPYYAHMEEKTKNLDVALNSFKTPHSFEVYSSSRHDPHVLKNEAGIVHHPAYLSTSINPEVALGRDHNQIYNPKTKSFDLNIMKIHVPEGHAGVYVPNISRFHSEREFLLPRGLNMKHLHTHSIPIAKEYHFMTDSEIPSNVHIHHMEIVHHEKL